MFVDFAFFVAPRLACVCGWTTQKGLSEAQLFVDGEDVFPSSNFFTHRREDIADQGGVGYFAVFETPDEGAPESATLILGEESFDLDTSAMAEGFDDFVEKAVFETFFEYIYALGHGLVPAPTPEMVTHLIPRIDAIKATSAERGGVYIAIDAASTVADLALGYFEGWNLSKFPAARNPSLMLFGASYLKPAEVMLRAINRADLGVFRDRYPVSGIDGFSGMYDLSGEPDSDPVTHVLIVTRTEDGPLVAVRPTSKVSYHAYAEYAVRLKNFANRPFTSLAPPPCPGDTVLRQFADASKLPDRAEGDPKDVGEALSTTLVLDHDASDSDLRDILRRVINNAPSISHIHILRPVETRDMTMAIAGANRENEGAWTGEISVGDVMDLKQVGETADAMMFASSSSLFQFEDWADLLTRQFPPGVCGAVQVYDPIMGLSRTAPDPKRIAQTFFQSDPPFVALLRLKDMPDPVTAFLDRFITPDGQLKAVLWALSRLDAIEVGTISSAYYYAGLRHNTDDENQAANMRKFDAFLLAQLQERIS